MPTSKLTTKGQVTIPKEIRDRLGLQVGDMLEFRLDSEGRLVVRVRSGSEDICGSLRNFAPETPISVEEMKAAVRRRGGRRGSPEDE